MATNKEGKKGHPKEHLAMKTPPIVSQEEWEAARQQLLVKEKALTRARDALAAERRRMPWMAVEKKYEFDGPKGKVSLLDLFESRRQLIVYRAFFEPGVFGWPEHACRGCSFVADQVGHVAHLNARDTTLVFVSRLPFGYLLLHTLLLFRGPFARPGQAVGDVLGFGVAAAAAAAGFGLAAVVAPWLTQRWHPIAYTARLLALSAVAGLALAPWLTPWTVSATNFVVSFAAQTVKISTDSRCELRRGR